MKEPSENDPSNLARQRLAQACEAMDKTTRFGWAMMVGEAALLAMLGLAVADYWLMMPVLLRTAGSLGLALLLIIGVVRLVRFYRRPTRLKQGALVIESGRPELGCEVSTAAEYLAGERKLEHEYEPELAAALEAKTARALGGYSIPVPGKLIGYAALMAITLLALVFLVLAAPGGLTALERTAVPFSKAHYTTLEVKPGNTEVAIGRNVEITNIFSGRLPKVAHLSWSEKNAVNWQTAALTGDTQGIYLHTLTNLQADLTYRVAGSDAVSPEYKITTYIPPTVQDFNVRLNYPAYTKRGEVVQKSPDISVLRASTAEIRIQPSVGLKQARLRFSSGPERALTGNPDGTWSGNVPIAKDVDYWIELADAKGHTGVNEKPYHIKALPDNPPKVEISDPGKDIRSSSTNKVLVKISVSDDFGVEQIKLVFNKLGGAQQTVDAEREPGPNGEVLAKAELDLSTMGLKDYELVAYHAEASDNNTLDGPGIGRSPVYFIEITDEEAGKSLAQGQSQKVNLLVIQKQIVADTTALASASPEEKFKDLAVRQRDAAEFGRMYLDAISGGDAEAAATEMHAAITDMEVAGIQLEKQQRSGAISPEESALAHLYQVVKLLPELGNLPTTPTAGQKPPPSPKMQVVLEAIKQKNKEQPDNKEIEDALNQAKDLARAQSGLNIAMRHPGQPGDGRGQAGASPANSDSKPQPSKSQAKGSGQGQGQGQEQGNGDEPSDSTADAQAQAPQSPAQIAQKEDELSKEAAALAERLQRMAGKDKRLGHNPGSGAGRAAAKMAAAGQAMAAGSVAAAGEHGFQGQLALRNVVDQLERLLKNQPAPSDFAHEDSPKEYDALIGEYLKRLSHAE